MVDFAISALIAGSFLYSHITPYFGKFHLFWSSNSCDSNIFICDFFIIVDPSMKVFGVMCASVIALGSVVGGVIGVLLPKISTGIAVGFLVALFVELVRIYTF